MKYIKLFEAKKTYAQKAKELFDKFNSLIDESTKIEVEDVMRSIFDITGSPTKERYFISWSVKGTNKTGITSALLHDVDTYKWIKYAYDNLLLDNLTMDAVLSYEFSSFREEVLDLVEDEVAYVKETLESMGYEFKYQRPETGVLYLIFRVIKKDVDASSIIEEKEYYSSLPKSIIKPFGLFMMQYKVPDEKAAEFANLLRSADWSKE
jgi:uncharacterized protein YcgL (UPF0745 family)